MFRMLCLAVALIAVGCHRRPQPSLITATDLKRDLQAVASARIYFGHQSVGANVIEGLRDLASHQGVSLRILEAPAEGTGPGIVHAAVGKNREPETKCDAFSRFLTARAGNWDAAILKFCYADLGHGAAQDPRALFELYRRTVDAVRNARPDLLLVHTTMPLQSEGLGKRDRIRRLLGFGTSNDHDNMLRNDFNDLVRAEYGGGALFDLAWAESTWPDGKRSGFHQGNRFIFTMARGYTYDEGHLTVEGRRWVAREFARSVAAALRTRPNRSRDASAPAM